MKGHRLILTDRADERSLHIHRYTPACSCGEWVGQHRRSEDEAADLWRISHIAPIERLARGRNRRRRRAVPLAPRPVTPADELPDELRAP